MTAAEVIAGKRRWSAEQSDGIAWLNSLPANAVDCIVSSPPYLAARLYLEAGQDLGVARDCQDWIDWMLEVSLAAQRVVRGPMFWVVAGVTQGRSYQPGPEGLAYLWWRRGGDCQLYRPCVFHRVGIPGSGGAAKDHAANGGSAEYFRADWEFVLCMKRPGKLPWADCLATGHPPKWAPGGEMSNRLANGARVNQWGHSLDTGATVVDEGGVVRSEGRRPSHVEQRSEPEPDLFGEPPQNSEPDPWSKRGRGNNLGGRNPDGSKKLGTNSKGPFGNLPTSQGREKDGRPKKRLGQNMANGIPGSTKGSCVGRRVVRGSKDGDTQTEDAYLPPVLANPGNLMQQLYTADEVAALLALASDVSHHNVGGGAMGHPLAHQNEAPYPLSLAEIFVLSFCPPGGIVCDPFSGSGTTGHAALWHGRRFVGCDLRQSQVELTQRRLGGITPPLWV